MFQIEEKNMVIGDTYFCLLNSTFFGELFLQLLTCFVCDCLCSLSTRMSMKSDLANIPSLWLQWLGDVYWTQIGQSQFFLNIYAGTLENMHPFVLESQMVRKTDVYMGVLVFIYQLHGRRIKTRPTHIGRRTRNGERKETDYHLNPWNLLCPICKCLCAYVHSWTSRQMSQ